MKKMKTRLTAAVIEEISTRLKAGSSDRVAVESASVSWAHFQQWLRRAEQPGSRGLVRKLDESVTQARAQAKLRAEMEVREKDAKVWLFQGPGRVTSDSAAPDAHGRLFELCTVVLKALIAFPEARASVAEALTRWDRT